MTADTFLLSAWKAVYGALLMLADAWKQGAWIPVKPSITVIRRVGLGEVGLRGGGVLGLCVFCEQKINKHLITHTHKEKGWTEP